MTRLYLPSGGTAETIAMNDAMTITAIAPWFGGDGRRQMSEIDSNKTALTHRVTAVAAAFLDGIGCKPVETEVAVAPGWIADLASFIYPTRTEAKKLKFTRHADEWFAPVAGSDVSLWLGRYDKLLTVLVEVKVSRSDYAGDVGRKFGPHPPCHLCFLAYPKGELTAADVPAGWYGLECSRDGSKLMKVITYDRERGTAARCWPQHAGQTIAVVSQVAIRREHRSRYRAIRDWWKSYRARDRQRNDGMRVSGLTEVVCGWIEGNGFGAELPLDQCVQRRFNKPLEGHAIICLKRLETMCVERGLRPRPTEKTPAGSAGADGGAGSAGGSPAGHESGAVA